MYYWVRTLIQKLVAGICSGASNSGAQREEKSPPKPWRSFLGWCLAICFVWELMVRPVLITYCPGLILPPSVFSDLSRLLLGLVGVGL